MGFHFVLASRKEAIEDTRDITTMSLSWKGFGRKPTLQHTSCLSIIVCFTLPNQLLVVLAKQRETSKIDGVLCLATVATSVKC